MPGKSKQKPTVSKKQKPMVSKKAKTATETICYEKKGGMLIAMSQKKKKM